MTTATETLAQYQALADQATKEPWEPTDSGLLSIDQDTGTGLCVAEFVRQADEYFIAASRTLGPAMATALQEILNLHAPFTWSFGLGEVESCKHCADLGASEDQSEYPCPTVATITKHLEGK